MNEELLQYLWMAGLFNAVNLQTIDGLPISIINRGRLNKHAGPDFSDARLLIGKTEWYGNIEIHYFSSEWAEHKHHLDAAYNNTILHVVFKDNSICKRQDGSDLPCLELCDRIQHLLIERYSQLKASDNWVACQDSIHLTDQISFEQTLISSLNNRLERKSDHIINCLQTYKNDWNSVFYIAVARSFGFGTNSDAFEQVARHIPLQLLQKHRQDTLQTEALIFGVSGFLDEEVDSTYFNQLKTEWTFLQSKYKLRSLDLSNFKFMRMRPNNFPGIRLSQLANLAGKCSEIFNALVSMQTIHTISEMLACEASEFWKTHFHFKKEAGIHETKLSEKGIHQILINAVAPVLYVYGKHTGNTFCCEKSYHILQSLPAENNTIIRQWKSLSFQAKNAFDSQALLDLKTHQCAHKNCLNCPIGLKIIKQG